MIHSFSLGAFRTLSCSVYVVFEIWDAMEIFFSSHLFDGLHTFCICIMCLTLIRSSFLLWFIDGLVLEIDLRFFTLSFAYKFESLIFSWCPTNTIISRNVLYQWFTSSAPHPTFYSEHSYITSWLCLHDCVLCKKAYFS